jgi:hypothetical protein
LTEVPKDTPEFLTAHPTGPSTVLATQGEIFPEIPGVKLDDGFFFAVSTVKAIVKMEHHSIFG